MQNLAKQALKITKRCCASTLKVSFEKYTMLNDKLSLSILNFSKTKHKLSQGENEICSVNELVGLLPTGHPHPLHRRGAEENLLN